MTAAQAWTRGWQTLFRYPWLALLPLGFNAAQIGLAWLGIPVGPVMDLGRLSDRGFMGLMAPHLEGGPIRPFLPSWLPGLIDLQVPIQPEATLVPVGLQSPILLFSLLVLPLVEALVTATYLVLLARIVTTGSVRLAGAIPSIGRALPGLYILGLGWHMAYSILTVDALLGLGLVWVLLFPLLTLIIGAGDRPLGRAILEAPGALWGRLGRWLGLGWRTGLVTVLFTLGWMFTGGSLAVALALYPVIATGLVASAVALYLEQDGAPENRPVWRAWLAVPPLVAALSMGAAYLAGQWEGYRVTRELAIEDNPIWMESPPRIVKVVEHDDRELIIYRGVDLGVAELERSRFGWKRLWHFEIRTQGQSFGGQLAWLQWIPYHLPPYQHLLLIGELRDSRVAYLEVGGERFPMPPEDPVILIRFPYEVDYAHLVHGMRFLDIHGQPLEQELEVRP